MKSFDELKEMSIDELEAYRSELVKDVIDNAPERLQKRLRGLQFVIECEIKLAKTPYKAAMKLSEMMQESLLELNSQLQNFTGCKTNLED